MMYIINTYPPVDNDKFVSTINTPINNSRLDNLLKTDSSINDSIVKRLSNFIIEYKNGKERPSRIGNFCVIFIKNSTLSNGKKIASKELGIANTCTIGIEFPFEKL